MVESIKQDFTTIVTTTRTIAIGLEEGTMSIPSQSIVLVGAGRVGRVGTKSLHVDVRVVVGKPP